MTDLAPVPPRERVITLDVLRGFALCGVLIGNMVLYSGRWAERGAAPPELSTLDQIAEWFLTIFVHSKAQTLLTFLFGFGFALQLLRAEERGEPVLGLYLRRLLVLFVLGWLHVTLLWWGDVTWGYAIAGLGLLPFHRASNRARVLWGLGFIFVPSLLFAIPEVAVAAIRLLFEPKASLGHMARMAEALHRPEHAGLAWEHARYALMFSARIAFWYLFWLIGRFLLGYVAGKLRWFERDGAEHLAVFRRFLVWGGAIGVVTTAFSALVHLQVLPIPRAASWARVLNTFVEQVGLLAMTLAYIGIVVLLIQRAPWRRVLALLAPVGRMPLTVYYGQSVICTFLFYGWGLGWAGSVGTAGTVGLAVAIFAVQIALCHGWLRWFRFGPLEWVWRSAVYLKPQPMRVVRLEPVGAPGPASSL